MAFCVNFKYFISGAPDLLLFRVRRRTSEGVQENIPISRYAGENWKESANFRSSPSTAVDDPLDLSVPIKNKKQRSSSIELHSTPSLHLADSWTPSLHLADSCDEENSLSVIEDFGNETSRPALSLFECPFPEDVQSLLDDIAADELVFESALVEVKGPTDRLSTKQTTWLNLLENKGIRAFVCRVRENKRHSG
jgi:hypothetical protein